MAGLPAMWAAFGGNVTAMRRRLGKSIFWLGLVALLPCLPGGAGATETLRVANAAPTSFFFIALDAGVQQGVFARRGLDVQPLSLFGGGKGAQAMAAGSVDMELGGAPELAYAVKGAPERGVADPVAIPGLMAFIVPPDGATDIRDLRGKTVAISTLGSLTDWLGRETARREGWGPDGMRLVALGAGPGMAGALRTHQVDATIQDLPTGYRLEKAHEGRILIRVQQVIPDYLLHTIFARQAVLQDDPAAVRSFLAGWFESVAWMAAHRDGAVALAQAKLQLDPDIASRAYDELMPMFSHDGKFPQAGLAMLANSFVQLGQFPQAPDLRLYVTEAYLPQESTP
jgi:NitT/TauT family transport system substrate-binding protein